MLANTVVESCREMMFEPGWYLLILACNHATIADQLHYPGNVTLCRRCASDRRTS